MKNKTAIDMHTSWKLQALNFPSVLLLELLCRNYIMHNKLFNRYKLLQKFSTSH